MDRNLTALYPPMFSPRESVKNLLVRDPRKSKVGKAHPTCLPRRDPVGWAPPTGTCGSDPTAVFRHAQEPELSRRRVRWIPAFEGMTAVHIIPLLAIALLLSACQSADKYRRPPVADTTSTPGYGTLAVQGSPDQIQLMRAYAGSMDAADSIWTTGQQDRALKLADSLRHSAEATLDTIAIGDPVSKFLLIYVAQTYDRMAAWEKDRGNEDAAKALATDFESLAARLQKRRDSAAVIKTQ